MENEVVPSGSAGEIRHHYPLAIREATLGTALGLFLKTLPYALVRFGILLAVSIITIIWAVITFGGAAWAGEKIHPWVGLGWLGGGCFAYGWAWRIVARYALYLIKCGHIAVLTELIVHGKTGNDGEGLFAYGKRVVTERFGQVNILFAMDVLVEGVVRAFNRTLDWIGHLLPVPGMQGLMNLVKAILFSAATYLDETIFSYLLARGETNPWRGGQDGLVYYCQNAKPVLKTAIWVVILDKLFTLVLWGLMLLPALLIAKLIGGATGIWAVGIAVLFAANARAAFLEPLFLIMVMTTFHVSVENQPINPEWDARLDRLSGKFRDLKAKAAAWVPGPPAAGTA